VDWNLERVLLPSFLPSFFLSFSSLLLFFSSKYKGRRGRENYSSIKHKKKKKKKGKQYNEHPPQKIKKNPMSVNSAIMDMVVYMRI
jgi:hypothetical protein